MEGFVSCNRTGGAWLPGLSVLAGRNDRGSVTGGDGVMAFAGVKGAIGGDASDLLIGRDLVQQLGQHRRVAHVAARELGRPDLQRLLVDPDVDLAPDAPFGASVLARTPLAFTLDLDAGAVDQEVQRALRCGREC